MNKWPWFLLSILVIVLDQTTKYWVEATLLPYQPVQILPMLNITLAFNTGVAFSALSNVGSWSVWFFIGFSLLVSVGLLIWLIRMKPSDSFLQKAAISLILGGAIGNLCDRILAGHVIDFIDVFYHQYHWPIFNIADSAICIGAFLLVLEMFIPTKASSSN